MRELKTSDGYLAYDRVNGQGTTVVWLGGFKSDMTGTKAQALADWARAAGRAFVRFDYYGHGQSSGRFADGTIGRWRHDALAVIDQLTEGPLILVGSSMGGWIASLCVQARPQRISGLVLIAPAPDFTVELMEPAFSDAARRDLAEKGVWERPSAYGDGPYSITQEFLDEACGHCVLGAPIAFEGPVRILHGMKDTDVPWQLGVRLAEVLTSQDVVMHLIKDGDHRLSTPADLARLVSVLEHF